MENQISATANSQQPHNNRRLLWQPNEMGAGQRSHEIGKQLSISTARALGGLSISDPSNKIPRVTLSRSCRHVDTSDNHPESDQVTEIESLLEYQGTRQWCEYETQCQEQVRNT